MAKVELGIEFCGIEFKNPFLLGSGPPTGDAERIKRAAKAGWSGVVTKTIGPKFWPPGERGPIGYSHPRPNYFVARGIPNIEKSSPFGLQNITGIDSLGKARWFQKELKASREAGIPIIASIAAPTLEGWEELARGVEEAGADMIEMNTAGPYAITEMGMGVEVGKDPKKVFEAVKATKGACSIPVMAKLSGHITPSTQVEFAKSAELAGADAISAINTVLSLVGIDVETGIPIPVVENMEGKLQSIFCGISGPVIKPIALRVVAQTAQAVKIPISGIGGIVDWMDAVEFIMVGSKNVQCVTGPMVLGFGMVRDMIKGLTAFMERKGYRSVDDFRGVSLKYIGSYGTLKPEPPVKAVVDESLCNGCGKCVPACQAGGGEAMRMEEGLAKVDEAKCWGCNLCVLVCPQKAVSLTGLATA